LTFVGGKPPYTQPYKEMQGSYSGIEHLQLKWMPMPYAKTCVES